MPKARIAAFFLGLVLLFTALSPVASAEGESLSPPSVEKAAAVYFYHPETDAVIVEKNAQSVINAGSTAKILSGLIFCEVLGNRTADPVYITEDMTKGALGYRLKLQAGDTLTVEQLLYAALCSSYNDAYAALAVYIAGSTDAFVTQMNARAKELGAKNSVFTDPSGIDDGSLTSALDLSKIALAASQNALYMTVTSTARYRLEETQYLDAQTLHNRNALIASNTTTKYYNAKCRGMNAGYTDRGGSCVVTLADNGSERYLCIVMGAPEEDTVNYGYTVANSLIDWVYKTYRYMEVISPDTVICTVPVTVSDLTDHVEVKTHDSLSCYLPAGLELGVDITYSIRLTHTTLEAPVTEGEQIGYVAILWNGKTLGTVPLYTAGSAERSSFVSSLKSIRSLTQGRAFVAGAVFFAIGLAAWITAECIVKRRRHRKWDKYFSMKMTPTPDVFKPKNNKGNL